MMVARCVALVIVLVCLLHLTAGQLAQHADSTSVPTPAPTPEPTPAPTPEVTPEPTPEVFDFEDLPEMPVVRVGDKVRVDANAANMHQWAHDLGMDWQLARDMIMKSSVEDEEKVIERKESERKSSCTKPLYVAVIMDSSFNFPDIDRSLLVSTLTYYLPAGTQIEVVRSTNYEDTIATFDLAVLGSMETRAMDTLGCNLIDASLLKQPWKEVCPTLVDSKNFLAIFVVRNNTNFDKLMEVRTMKPSHWMIWNKMTIFSPGGGRGSSVADGFDPRFTYVARRLTDIRPFLYDAVDKICRQDTATSQ